jgi:hypothetical protein
MGYVREPDEIDFIVSGKEYSETERMALSEIIRQYKEKQSKQLRKSKTRVRRKKMVL